MDTHFGITRDQEKCIGCRACEVACSLRSESFRDLSRSNIAGVKVEGETFFSVCRHCEKPECLAVCPVGAIVQDEQGIVRIGRDRCIGCGTCSSACSRGGIRLISSPTASRSTKCDLCDGHPLCVSLCPQGALAYRGQGSLAVGWKNSEDLVSPGISSCLGCNAELALRFALRILGRNTILAIPPGCLGGVGVVGFGMTTGAKVPVFFPLLDNVAAMLSGIKREYRRKGVEVNVVAFAGDGGTADVGFQCLSAAAERGENIVYICYDNEGYMNTGFQRSGTTPLGAWTSTTPVGKKGIGKKQRSKNLPMIMAAHEIPYVATACMSYPDDFERKLKKAMAVRDGLVYIHLLSPCSTGWRVPPEKTIEVGRLAVETNFFPLWEMERGDYRFTFETREPKPIETFLGKMGKYNHLTRKQIQEIRNVLENRYDVLKSLVLQSGGR
jgi:phenylglyoxylate dehydrogenase beta subunit